MNTLQEAAQALSGFLRGALQSLLFLAIWYYIVTKH